MNLSRYELFWIGKKNNCSACLVYRKYLWGLHIFFEEILLIKWYSLTQNGNDLKRLSSSVDSLKRLGHSFGVVTPLSLCFVYWLKSKYFLSYFRMVCIFKDRRSSEFWNYKPLTMFSWWSNIFGRLFITAYSWT